MLLDSSIKLFGGGLKHIPFSSTSWRSSLDVGWLEPNSFFSMLFIDISRAFIITYVGYSLFIKIKTKFGEKPINNELMHINSSSFSNENLIYNWCMITWKDSFSDLFIYLFIKIKINLVHLSLDIFFLQIFNYDIFFSTFIFLRYILKAYFFFCLSFIFNLNLFLYLYNFIFCFV